MNAKDLRHMFQDHGPRAIIKATSGSNHDVLSGLWCAAMTLAYGPAGLHKAWTNADGSPSEKALAELPMVRQAMARAAEKMVSLLDYIDRMSAHELRSANHALGQLVAYR